MNVRERAKEIREAEAKLAKLRDYGGPSEIEPEVTAAIPAGPGNLFTLWHAIASLERGAQSVPLCLHLTAQENALPEAAALEAARDFWMKRVAKDRSGNERVFADWKFLKMIPNFGGDMKNIVESRKALIESVETPYLLFLDADVRMPAGGVGLLLEAMRADPECGELGIQYNPHANLVLPGCTMLRTAVAKRIEWQQKSDAVSICESVVKQGYTVRHLKSITACHMRFGMFS